MKPMIQTKTHTLPRLFIRDGLENGAMVSLTAEQCHYVLHVMRLKAGASIRLFNGRDGEWLGVIEQCTRREVILQITEQLRPQQPEPDCGLIFTPLKPEPMHFLIEKATELGVSALFPVSTAHSVARFQPEKIAAYAESAAEQSERLTIPAINPLMPFVDLLESWSTTHPILLCDEAGGGRPLGEVIPGLNEGNYTIMVGPEGGFSHSELELLRKLPYVIPVGLGPRILRAETAALAALACFQAVHGDWRMAPRFISH